MIDPEQAETVRMIFDLYLDGYGLVKIKEGMTVSLKLYFPAAAPAAQASASSSARYITVLSGLRPVHISMFRAA